MSAPTHAGHLKGRSWAFSLLFGALLFAPAASGVGTPAFPRRVISMAPNLTQIMYDIGAQDSLVGVTDFCVVPPEARLKEKVGGWINPSFEKIVSLRPDLVLVLQKNGQTIDTLRKLHIPLLELPGVSLSDILGAYDALGRTLGRVKEAAAARKRLEKRLDLVRKRAAGRTRPTLLFVVGHDPGTLKEVYGVGSNNFIDELIRLAGGSNLFSDASVPYPLISKEQLIRRDPDIIISALPRSEVRPEFQRKEKSLWDGMPSLRAVRGGRVYCFVNDDFMIPGPSMVGLAEYLSGVIRETSNKSTVDSPQSTGTPRKK